MMQAADMTLVLGAGWITSVLFVLFLGSCLLLMLTVLIQKPQGGGLAGAFGSGAGSGQTAFGTRTGDALTVATIAMFVIFIVLAVLLNYAARPEDPRALSGASGTSTEKAPADQPATTPPANAPVTAPPATNTPPAASVPPATPAPATPAPSAPAAMTPPAAAPATTPAPSTPPAEPVQPAP